MGVCLYQRPACKINVIFEHAGVVWYNPQGSVCQRLCDVTPSFRFSEHQQDAFWVRKRPRMKTRVPLTPSIFMKEIGKCKQKLFRQKLSNSSLHSTYYFPKASCLWIWSCLSHVFKRSRINIWPRKLRNLAERIHKSVITETSLSRNRWNNSCHYEIVW